MHQKASSILATFLAFGAYLIVPAVTANTTTVVDLNYTLQQGYLKVCLASFHANGRVDC